MKKDVVYRVIGVMSGTSVDGLDMAFCELKRTSGKWTTEILEATTIEFEPQLRHTLQNCMHAAARDLIALDLSFGRWIGERIKQLVEKHQLQPDFVSSHGHTVFHQPEDRLTYQIGNGFAIFQACNIPVVADFRVMDVLFEGQGAPLVPMGDQLLFSNYQGCLNLGGIANLSFRHDERRIALDICACNLVLNWLAQRNDRPYDKGGNMARKGALNEELLEALNALDYYAVDPPKSLGLEWVEEQIFSLPQMKVLDPLDALHTYCHHIAIQINQVIEQFLDPDGIVLITGGGAYNHFLIEVLNDRRPGNITFDIPDHHLIDYKEAMVFALLGALRWENEINCLGSVTGASANVSGGVIYQNHIEAL